MSGTQAGLALSVFLACAVEATEALTIVLAVGLTRSFSSALAGVAAALLALTALVAALGPTITLVPLQALRAIVGTLLLLFGLQWLRKAVLRAAGLKALHDEEDEFGAQRRAALAAPAGRGEVDRYSFAIAFKGVLLEGLEVAFIVVTFGSGQRGIGIAAAAAACAVALVVLAGLALRAPLTRVPENTMKLLVGVMLTSFGTFWSAEGVGARWPGSDAALLVIVPAVACWSILLAALLKRSASRAARIASRTQRRWEAEPALGTRGVR